MVRRGSEAKSRADTASRETENDRGRTVPADGERDDEKSYELAGAREASSARGGTIEPGVDANTCVASIAERDAACAARDGSAAGSATGGFSSEEEKTLAGCQLRASRDTRRDIFRYNSCPGQSRSF